MDKVKQFLRIALKHHFWILCVVLGLAIVGVWYMAAGNLQAAFNKNKGVIEGAAGPVSKLASETNHPNEQFTQRVQAEIDKDQALLAKEWGDKYNAQAEILKWPERSATRPTGLTPDFVLEAKKWLPIEAKVKFEATPTPGAPVFEPLSDSLRLQYQNFVDDALKDLANTVRAKWQPGLGATSSGERGGTQLDTSPNGQTAVVRWRGNNQNEIVERYKWAARPTTLEVLYAQEDLWVLDALMKIIAKANAGAEYAHHAAVKEIVYVKLGAEAFGATGNSGSVIIAVPPVPLTPSSDESPPMNIPDSTSENPMAVQIKDPAKGRYVYYDETEKKLKPVLPEELRANMEGEIPAKPMLALAKRIPVRMHLIVDQRKLNRLLAEFCNSKLEVEIRQTRFNCPLFTADVAGATPTRGGGFGGGEVRTAPVPAMRRGGPSGNTDQGGSSHDVEVELFGLAYIYNPPKLAGAAGETPATMP